MELGTPPPLKAGVKVIYMRKNMNKRGQFSFKLITTFYNYMGSLGVKYS